jgi:hypothetical protein
MRPTFRICCDVMPQRVLPFFILETVITSDGPRTRVCDKTYPSLEAARDAVAEKESQL